MKQNYNEQYDYRSDEAVRDSVRSDVRTDEYGEQVFDYQYEGSDYIVDHPDSVIAYWQGPEYEVLPKSKRWYTVMILAIAVIVLYAVWTNNHIVAILFLTIGAVGFLYIITPPRVMDFAITLEGIVAGNQLYPYDEIESFWIFYEPPHTRIISFRIDGHWFPYLHVPLHELDPVEVRAALLEHVIEQRQEHTVVDTMERLLKI